VSATTLCLLFIVAALGMIAGAGAMGAYVNRPYNSTYLAAAAAAAQQQTQTQSSEMVIPNELIGCVIGRGGAKIKGL